MIKPIKLTLLTLINDLLDLLLTHEVLKRNMEELEHGKRFDQFPEGHDHYEKTVKEAVAIVEARLEVFRK
ncbi:hypothetical protein [Klebsiella quasipneumoniae]|nr:hypothetical protein [Klebsiella quasipneumoniae]BDO06077.1 hypothetical protein KAM622c_56640 [Klebsiella quasipneumoniae subsp. quasipneumoniae]